jgi:hypothetical protein
MAHTVSETPHRVGTLPESRQACNIVRSAHANPDLARAAAPFSGLSGRRRRHSAGSYNAVRMHSRPMPRTAPVRALTVSTSVGILIGLSVAADRGASTAAHRGKVFRGNRTMRLADKRAPGWRHFFRWV